MSVRSKLNARQNAECKWTRSVEHDMPWTDDATVETDGVSSANEPMSDTCLKHGACSHAMPRINSYYLPWPRRRVECSLSVSR